MTKTFQHLLFGSHCRRE